MYPLQYLIVRIINNISFTSSMFAVNTLKGLAPAYSIRMATAVMAIGPIIILYPFMQKFFIQGLMVGSIKE